MATTAQRSGQVTNPIAINDDDNSIDEDQLNEYREDVEMLGSFPVSQYICFCRLGMRLFTFNLAHSV